MSDTRLLALGAEVVCGDLILNRQVVGMYRHGQFMLTPEGEAALNDDAIEAEAPAPRAAAPRAAAPGPRKVRSAPKDAPTAEASDVESAIDGADALLGGLDTALAS